MPRVIRNFLGLVQGLLFVAVMNVSLAAQEPITIANLNVETAELKIMLLPLTAEDLIAEADAWRDALKARTAAVGVEKIKAERATGAEEIQANSEASRLRGEQDAVAERLGVVVAALKKKGGDAESYEKYMVAVAGGLFESPDEAGALFTRGVEWLKSGDGGLLWVRNIVFFILILIASRFLARVVSGLAGRAVNASRLEVSEILEDFFVATVRKVVFFIGLILALSIIGLDIGPFLAAIGVLGFVIGFALQNTLSNFAAGLMILLYRPFDIGDWVTAAGVTGSVDTMSLVSTTLKTGDNQSVVVPNGSIWGGVITNSSANETRRVDLVIGIGYDDDIAKAEKILREIVTAHEKVLKDPEPVIQLTELADSSVNFNVRPWAKTGDRWSVLCDVTRQVKERFDAEGISIPYPQQDVHMHQVAD